VSEGDSSTSRSYSGASKSLLGALRTWPTWIRRLKKNNTPLPPAPPGLAPDLADLETRGGAFIQAAAASRASPGGTGGGGGAFIR
jgi:hypothetical protein